MLADKEASVAKIRVTLSVTGEFEPQTVQELIEAMKSRLGGQEVEFEVRPEALFGLKMEDPELSRKLEALQGMARDLGTPPRREP